MQFDFYQDSNLTLTPSTITTTGSTVVSIEVMNTGSVDSDEVVQLYLTHEYSSTTTPVLQLIDFDRVFISKGETQTISFVIKASQHLAILDRHYKVHNYLIANNYLWVVEPGIKYIKVGPSSDNILITANLTVH